MNNILGTRFLKASLIYFAVTVAMGVVIIIEPIYRFTVLSSLFQRAHAHLGLIGWMSLAMIGFIYMAMGYINKRVYSERLGNMGFWLLNIGISVEFIILLFGGYVQASLYRAGDPNAHAITVPFTMALLIFALLMTIGIYMTIYNIYKSFDKE